MPPLPSPLVTPVTDAAPSGRPAAAADEPVQVRLLFDAGSESIIDVAGAVRTLLRCEAEALRGRPLGSIIEMLPGQCEAPWRQVRPGDSAAESIVTVLTPSGARHLVSAQASAFRRQGGRVMGLLLLSDWVRPDTRSRNRLRHRRQLEALAYELTVAESRERERLANGLHDTLGQLLAIAQFRLNELRQGLAGGAWAQRADEIAALLSEAAGEARRATFELHPPLLRQLGLGVAIESLAERLHRQGGPAIEVHGQLDPGVLEPAAQAVVLRVVRELLLNVYKHAAAQRVSVHLSCTRGRLVIAVIDDGCGCAPRADRAPPGPGGGYGLSSAEAQMQALGGRLELSSAPGVGTTVRLSLSLRGAARRRQQAVHGHAPEREREPEPEPEPEPEGLSLAAPLEPNS